MSDDALQIVSEPLNVLLVEGRDDAQVFFHLLQRHHLEKRLTIQNKDGIEKLLKELDVELDRPRLGRLGIVVDADVNISPRWQSLQDRLRECGYRDLPLSPDPDGTVIEQENRPTVGIWLMPNNTLPGMLEDFVGLLVPTGDVLWPMAEDIVQKVIVKDRRFPQTQRTKAHIHTWLAWQKEPGKPMGQAITKRYLDTTTPHAQRLIDWIRRLFNLGTA